MPEMGAGHLPLLYIPDGASRYAKLPALTTTQRDALTAVAGMVLYNSTTGQVEGYNGSAWVAIGKLYGDATFLPLAGGNLTGNLTLDAGKTVDGVDVSAIPKWIQRPIGVTLSGLLFTAAGGASAGGHNNNLHASPLWFGQKLTLDRLGVKITGAGGAGALVRVGLYADSGVGHPTGAALVDGGTVDATGTGVLMTTISYAIATPGLYWLVANCNDAAVTWERANGGTGIQLVGAITSNEVGWQVASAYGALPTWPGGEAAFFKVPIPYYRILSYP